MASIVLLIGVSFKVFPFRTQGRKRQKRFSIFVDYLVESVYNFFSEIL